MALSENGKERYKFALDLADEVYEKVAANFGGDHVSAATLTAAIMAEIGRAETTDRVCGLLDHIAMDLSKIQGKSSQKNHVNH